jgi:hypothetical protein
MEDIQANFLFGGEYALMFIKCMYVFVNRDVLS